MNCRIRDAITARIQEIKAAERARAPITSQNRLADAIGVNRGQLSSELNGNRPMPAGRLEAIAEALGIEFEEVGR